MLRYINILIITLCVYGSANAQLNFTNISGIVNKYAKVDSILSADKIRVDSVTDFAVGDTVLLIQMKGAGYTIISGENSPMYGAGKYEYTIINSISTSTREIVFHSNMLNSAWYNAKEGLQLVRIPTYKNAKVVSGGLTCRPWNGTRGGVVSIFVEGILELNDSIYADHKGFAGANFTQNAGLCPSYKGKLFYSESEIDSAGHKGEGVLSNISPYRRGAGSIRNAGGGGFGKFSGGGGGGNSGQGGSGGIMYFTCPDTYLSGGLGGSISAGYFAYKIPSPEYTDRLFLGGGGGAGTGTVPSSGSNGGNGGGLIYIFADTLISNNKLICSRGENVTKLSANKAGAGGGGGGGSIILSVNAIKDPLGINVQGGDGGWTRHCSGQGGGGGGGFAWFKVPFTNFSQQTNLTGGLAGIADTVGCGSNYAFNGTDGDTAFNLIPVLNGFLGNQIYNNQTICYNETPQLLTGTIPSGGNGIYAYQWQKRKVNTTTWVNISGAQQSTYQPAPLTDSTEFRRIVKSYQQLLGDSITDAGKHITINVIPEIKNNKVDPDTSVCYGLPKITLRGKTPLGGDGSFSYLWQTYNGSNWVNAQSINNLKDFSGTSNTLSQSYRRKVTSNICSTYSDTAVVTVYDSISGNSIGPDQIICYNYIPDKLKGVKTLGGGDSMYSYIWEKSNNSTTWSATGGTFADFTPEKLTNKTYFRRIVQSGLNATCKDTSSYIQIDITDAINHSTNTISASQTKCQNIIPDPFAGSQPAGGNSLFKYQWEKSTNQTVWDSITTSELLKNYTHTALMATTYFRRIVRSGVLDCCKDTSSLVTITVQPAIKGNSIESEQEICNSQTPQLLTQTTDSVVSGGNQSTYSYSWHEKNTSGSWTPISGVITSYYQPGTLLQTKYFRRSVVSGECFNMSDSLKINVLPQLSGNILTGKNEVCRNLNANDITGGEIIGGGETGIYRYSWQDSISGGEWNTLSAADQSIYSPGILSASRYFRRIVKSGLNDCCISKSAPFFIQINELPIAVLTDLDTVICKGSNLDVSVTLSGNSPFDIVLKNKLDQSDQIAKTNLISGLNTFSIQPTVTDSLEIETVVDSKGCLATNKSGYNYIRLVEVPFAYAGNDDSICGLQYKLSAIPSVGNGKWISLSGNPEFSDYTANNSTVTYNAYGIYKLRWKELNEFCADSSEISLSFFQQPLKPHIGADTILSYEFNFGLSVVPPTVGTGFWKALTEGISIITPNEPTSLATNLAFGKNEIVYTITNGNCEIVSDSILVFVDDIKRYSGFSPNGDGNNDYFEIDGLNNAETKKISILNRWGNVVFSSDNYNNKWQGTNNSGKMLPDDTYFYILIVDGSREYKGYIVLKR